MPPNWKEAASDKRYVLLTFLWLIALATFILILPYYFNYILLPKPGVKIDDLLFHLLKPRDWSSVIFALIFVAPAIFFITNFASPEKILVSIQCYVVVNFLRLLSLYLFTLETPEGIIPLVDPFLERVAYGGNATFTKDLFFSGHTSTLFIISLIEKRRVLKFMLLISTVLVGFLLIWQRVHYTIDVIGAILVTFAVFHTIVRLNRVTFRHNKK
jgi:hypothetical protein